MTLKLTRNAYSPASLAKELNFVVSAKTIRRHIEKGQLKAQRFGGKNLIITKGNAELWLNALPSATEPTSYHGSEAKRARSRRDLTVSEIAASVSRASSKRTARRRAKNNTPEPMNSASNPSASHGRRRR